VILTLAGIKHRGSLQNPSDLPKLLAAWTVALMLVVVLIASFILVGISRYAAVFERTREIGILRAFGASSAYVFKILLQEALLIAIPGTIIGIALAYGTTWVMVHELSDVTTQVTVYIWWPFAGAAGLMSTLLGAVLPARRAMNQDVIGAIAQEDVTEG